MYIEVSSNAPEVAGWFREIYADQLPFATAKAVNLVAVDAQEVQRDHQRRIFNVRRKRFVDRAVKIKPFARKGDPEAVIRVDPPGGQSRADIITKFEDQDRKFPFRSSYVAVPTANVPRTGAGIIRKGHRPKDFNLRGRGGRVFSRRSNVSVGERGTFVVMKPGRGGTLFQRQGGEVRPLYHFTPSVRLPPDLEFEANITRTVAARFDERFAEAWDAAIETAR